MNSSSHVPRPTMKKSGWQSRIAFVQISWTLSGRVNPSPGYAAETRRTPAFANPATNAGVMSYVPESPSTSTVWGTNGVGTGSVVTTAAADASLDAGVSSAGEVVTGAVVTDDGGSGAD